METFTAPRLAPEMALIGALGRDNGKTTLACTLIEKLAKCAPVVALKVICVEDPARPCHRGGEGCGLCGGLQGPFDLREEALKNAWNSEKDTARMLRAGAEKAYLLRSRPACMERAAEAFFARLPKGRLVVCESNRMRFAVKPGVFLLCTPPHTAQTGPEGQGVQNEAEKGGKPWARQLLPLADALLPFGAQPPALQPEKTAEGGWALHLCKTPACPAK